MHNTPFDKLFGDVKPSDVIKRVGELAATWKNVGTVQQELHAYLITKFCIAQESFTSDELQAYKKAFTDLELFLHQAEAEVDSLKAPKNT